MSDYTVARRYAQALYNEAEQAGLVAKVDDDVMLIQDSMEASRQLVQFFGSPIVSREKKVAVVRQLFEHHLQPLTFRFLLLLVEKQREELFPAIVRAYRDLRDVQLGVTEAHVRTAQPLASDERTRLVTALERKTGRKIRLREDVVPDLIGGVVIRVGDTVYDGSVQHQLETLRERLRSGATITPGGKPLMSTNHAG